MAGPCQGGKMADISNVGQSGAVVKALESQTTQRKTEEKSSGNDTPTGVNLTNEKDGYRVDISAGSQNLGRADQSGALQNSDDAREMASRLREQIFQQAEQSAMAQANIGPQSVLTFLK